MAFPPVIYPMLIMTIICFGTAILYILLRKLFRRPLSSSQSQLLWTSFSEAWLVLMIFTLTRFYQLGTFGTLLSLASFLFASGLTARVLYRNVQKRIEEVRNERARGSR